MSAEGQGQGTHEPGERMNDDAGDRPPRRPDVFARAFVNALAIAAGLTILLGWAF